VKNKKEKDIFLFYTDKQYFTIKQSSITLINILK